MSTDAQSQAKIDKELNMLGTQNESFSELLTKEIKLIQRSSFVLNVSHTAERQYHTHSKQSNCLKRASSARNEQYRDNSRNDHESKQSNKNKIYHRDIGGSIGGGLGWQSIIQGGLSILDYVGISASKQSQTSGNGMIDGHYSVTTDDSNNDYTMINKNMNDINESSTNYENNEEKQLYGEFVTQFENIGISEIRVAKIDSNKQLQLQNTQDNCREIPLSCNVNHAQSLIHVTIHFWHPKLQRWILFLDNYPVNRKYLIIYNDEKFDKPLFMQSNGKIIDTKETIIAKNTLEKLGLSEYEDSFRENSWLFDVRDWLTDEMNEQEINAIGLKGGAKMRFKKYIKDEKLRLTSRNGNVNNTRGQECGYPALAVRSDAICNESFTAKEDNHIV